MHTIAGETYVTDWDLRFLDRLPVGARVFHLLPDADSILHICEWKDSRYAAPVELPASPMAGSTIGDTGFRLPGAKHSAGRLNVFEREDGTRVLQVYFAARPVGSSSGPFYGSFKALPQIQLSPSPWAARPAALERALTSEAK
jgi:hypothetical protein